MTALSYIKVMLHKPKCIDGFTNISTKNVQIKEYDIPYLVNKIVTLIYC